MKLIRETNTNQGLHSFTRDSKQSLSLISQQTAREESDAGLEHSRISARANESGSVYKRNKGLPQRATVCANTAQRQEKGATGGMIDNNCDN